jgi:hypothetical protein
MFYIYARSTPIWDYLIRLFITQKKFTSIKFRQYIKSLVIKIKEIPIEAYNSIGKIKRYYTLL